jgi:acyl-CoA thioester hydrolase
MSTVPIVYRGYVNPWDCDEMGHMNVQFHVAKGSEAFDGLLMHLGLPREQRAQVRVAQHRIRFVKEMHVSDLVEIAAVPISFDGGRLGAQLEVRNAFADVCVRIDVMAENVTLPALELGVLENPPGGLEAGAEGDASLASAGSFRETIRNVVQPMHCDADGCLSPRGVMARISEAQGHLWAMLDAPRAWQREMNLATATLEFRIRYGIKPRAGTIVRLLTGVVAASAKTVRYRHWLFDAETGEMVAAVGGAALFLDRGVRRPVALPERVAAAAAKISGRS